MPPIQPLIALRDASVTFGGKPLFAGITLSLGRGERVALVGANGAGKSTILKALSGKIELDGGEHLPNLEQPAPLNTSMEEFAVRNRPRPAPWCKHFA